MLMHDPLITRSATHQGTKRTVSRAVEKIVIAGAGQAGGRAAANMGGDDKEYNDPPWFRTDQCDLNIQFTGDMCAADHLARGDPNCRERKAFARRPRVAKSRPSVRAEMTMKIP